MSAFFTTQQYLVTYIHRNHVHIFRSTDLLHDVLEIDHENGQFIYIIRTAILIDIKIV